MRGIEGDVVCRKHRDPFGIHSGDPFQTSAPAQAVVDKNEIGIRIRGVHEQSGAGVHAEDRLGHVPRSFKLKTVVGGIIPEGIQIQYFVQIGAHFVDRRHGSDLLSPVGSVSV